MLRIPVVCFLLVFLFISGCSQNPVTGESQFSIISASQEVNIGKQNYGPYQQQQGGVYSVDPELSFYVSKVGHKLAQLSDRPKLPYEFAVLNNDVPNAWALPGGKIAINRGLLLLLKDEAQLAAVLAHEIVHAAARHGASQMTKQALLGLGVQAVGIASQGSTYGDLIGMGANLGAGAWQASYGRSQELESDEHGIKYMVKAGYDPYAAVELQQTFLALSNGRQSNFFEGLFMSHPPSKERVDRNKATVQGFAAAGGVRNKSAYQQAIAQINKDKKAYDNNTKALKAAQEKNFDTALSLVKQAIKRQPEEALFYISRGQILLAKEQTTKALSAFNRATRINPDYYLGHLGLGLAQKKLGQNAKAKSSLEKSMALLSTQIGAYHLGELALKEGHRENAIKYFGLAKNGGGKLGEAAQKQLAKIQPTPQQ